MKRPPEAIWRVEAMRATSAGWRFITLSTNVPMVTCLVDAAAIDRIVHASTVGLPGGGPIRWSHAQTPA
jgi:hypothetical protein